MGGCCTPCCSAVVLVDKVHRCEDNGPVWLVTLDDGASADAAHAIHEKEDASGVALDLAFGRVGALYQAASRR